MLQKEQEGREKMMNVFFSVTRVMLTECLDEYKLEQKKSFQLIKL